MAVVLSQKRFMELQEWWRHAERCGILSHDIADLAKKVPSPPAPTAEEAAAFKAFLTALTLAKPGEKVKEKPAPGADIDPASYNRAADLHASISGYQEVHGLPRTGFLNEATWQKMAQEQGTKDPDLGPKTLKAFRDMEPAINKIKQDTIAQLLKAHALWVKARESRGLPVPPILRDPEIAVRFAGIESRGGDPRYMSNDRYNTALQVTTEKNQRGDTYSWFGEDPILNSTSARLPDMSRVAGQKIPQLQGSWNPDRIAREYKTNNYIVLPALMEYLARNIQNEKSDKGKELLATFEGNYLKHLLPAAFPMVRDALDKPDADKPLYALAVEKGKSPQTWGRYMVLNSGVLMGKKDPDPKQTVAFRTVPQNSWMKEWTTDQLGSAFRDGHPVSPATLISATPNQVMANARAYMEERIAEFRPQIDAARKALGIKVSAAASSQAKPPSGGGETRHPAAAGGTPAEQLPPLRLRPLQSI